MDINKTKITAEQLAKSMDSTLLKPHTEAKQIEHLCQQALEYNFASVCVLPYYVPLAQQILKGSSVKVCTVIGFPLGDGPTAMKKEQGEWAIEQGAQELDMVVHLPKVANQLWDEVFTDIQTIAQLPATVKVIIETCYLSEQEKKELCALVVQAKADFIKTSTGFGSAGAQQEDVRLMHQLVSPTVQVKASGGISNLFQAMTMLEAGATRLGVSAAVSIMKEFLNEPQPSQEVDSSY